MLGDFCSSRVLWVHSDMSLNIQSHLYKCLQRSCLLFAWGGSSENLRKSLNVGPKIFARLPNENCQAGKQFFGASVSLCCCWVK